MTGTISETLRERSRSVDRAAWLDYFAGALAAVADTRLCPEVDEAIIDAIKVADRLVVREHARKVLP